MTDFHFWVNCNFDIEDNYTEQLQKANQLNTLKNVDVFMQCNVLLIN